MAQLVVRNVDEKVKPRIQRMAKKRGHSLAEEVRGILTEAVKPEKKHPAPRRHQAVNGSKKPGLGTQIASLFRGRGLDFEIPEFRGGPDRSIRFDE